MSTSSDNLSRGYATALLSAVVLSTTAIFIRYLTQTYQLPALVLAFWRDVLVCLTLLVVFLVRRLPLLKVERRHLGYLAGYGLVLAIFNSMWTPSVALNGAAVATVLAYTSGAFTVVLGWAVLGERLSQEKIGAVLLSFSGCLLVSGALQTGALHLSPVGIFTGVFSGLCYAVYSLMGRSASQRGLNPWTTVFYTFGFASLYLIAFNLLGRGVLPGAAAQPGDFFWLKTHLTGWFILFLLAAGPTVLGFGLYNISLSYLPCSVANLIVTLEPVFTAVIAYVLLGERMDSVQIGGALLILAGVVILKYPPQTLAANISRRLSHFRDNLA